MVMFDEERRRVFFEEKARQEARHAYEEAQREDMIRRLKTLGIVLLGLLVGAGLAAGVWNLLNS